MTMRHEYDERLLAMSDENGESPPKAADESELVKEPTFEDFWNSWTRCPRCKIDDGIRLAASNAWYRQQQRIDDLMVKTTADSDRSKSTTTNEKINLILAKVEILKLKANDYSWKCETPKYVTDELEMTLMEINKMLGPASTEGDEK